MDEGSSGYCKKLHWAQDAKHIEKQTEGCSMKLGALMEEFK